MGAGHDIGVSAVLKHNDPGALAGKRLLAGGIGAAAVSVEIAVRCGFRIYRNTNAGIHKVLRDTCNRIIAFIVCRGNIALAFLYLRAGRGRGGFLCAALR